MKRTSVVNNMENVVKKRKKRVKKGPIVLLILILLGVGGFLYYRKLEKMSSYES